MTPAPHGHPRTAAAVGLPRPAGTMGDGRLCLPHPRPAAGARGAAPAPRHPWRPRIPVPHLRLAAANADRLRPGVAFAIPAGLLMGRSRLVAALFNPLLMTIYPVPKAALMPIIMLWLGIGDASKTLVIFLGVTLPVIYHSYQGARAVEEKMLWSAAAMGSRRCSGSCASCCLQRCRRSSSACARAWCWRSSPW